MLVPLLLSAYDYSHVRAERNDERKATDQVRPHRLSAYDKAKHKIYIKHQLVSFAYPRHLA